MAVKIIASFSERTWPCNKRIETFPKLVKRKNLALKSTLSSLSLKNPKYNKEDQNISQRLSMLQHKLKPKRQQHSRLGSPVKK